MNIIEIIKNYKEPITIDILKITKLKFETFDVNYQISKEELKEFLHNKYPITQMRYSYFQPTFTFKGLSLIKTDDIKMLNLKGYVYISWDALKKLQYISHSDVLCSDTYRYKLVERVNDQCFIIENEVHSDFNFYNPNDDYILQVDSYSLFITLEKSNLDNLFIYLKELFTYEKSNEYKIIKNAKAVLNNEEEIGKKVKVKKIKVEEEVKVKEVKPEIKIEKPKPKTKVKVKETKVKVKEVKPKVKETKVKEVKPKVKKVSKTKK